MVDRTVAAMDARHGTGGGLFGSAFVRDAWRCWRRAWKRFLSLALISLLGVAVLTGIYAGCRDAFLAADRFYDAQGLMDVQVLSTLGLTDDDVTALRRVSGVRAVQPERSQDVTVAVDGGEKSATIRELGTAGLNRPRLEAGRMPSAAGEIAVTDKFLKDSKLAVGDCLTVKAASRDTAGDADGTSSGIDGESAPAFPTDLTITGTVLDPMDLSNPSGYAGNNFRSTAASDYDFYAPSAGVTGNVYTAVSLTVTGAAALNTFDDRYDAAVKAVTNRIESAVQTDRQQARRQAIADAAQRKLDDAKTDAYTQLDDASKQLDSQQSTLDANKRTLADTRTQLEAKQTELNDGETQIASARSQIASGRQQIAAGRQQLAEARRQLDDGQRQLTAARTQLDAGRSELNASKTQAQQGLAQAEQMLGVIDQVRTLLDGLPSVDPGAIDAATWQRLAALLARVGVSVPQNPSDVTSLATIRTQLDQAYATIAAQRDQAKAGLETIAANEKTLNEQDAQLSAKEREAASGQATLNEQAAELEAQSTQLETQSAALEAQAIQVTSGKQQLEVGFKQLTDGETKLSDGQRQLDDAREQLKAKRADADSEFARQQQKIDDIAAAQWYVQTRDSIGGFNALNSDLTSIESIGRAFPVVFLLVAVLMAFTTMTRMVEEDRALIGTYMGLGYGNVAIAMRYALFALLACLLGGGAGLLVGFLGISAFLRLVIDEMYMVPDVRLEYDWTVGTLGLLLFAVGALAATAVACRGEMRLTPATLMRPKAPKAGARILLERIRPLWSRMSFLNKVAARNIFRFKSRLVMTVLGVAGCTALIVCGLAINDTINTIAPVQYGELYRYDLLSVSGGDDADADAMRHRIERDGRATETLNARLETGQMADAGGKSNAIQLVVVPEGDLARLNDMVALNRAGGDRGTVRLGDDGVIVEQSAANALGIRDGDAVMLTNGSRKHAQTKATAVTRNLIGTNVYVSEDLYRSLFVTAQAGGEGTVSAQADAQTDAQTVVPLTWNAVYATLSGSADERIAYVDGLKSDPSVLRAMSSDNLERSFKFDLMGAVVALITLLAGLLALVVLFTLANTNVSERVREMATLKVLGFFDREVHLYVHKEMTVLTLMGVAVGLPLGRFVGGLLTAALNMPGLYFAVSVKPLSYVIAAAATLAFALLVQLLTNPVLDRIDPVGSLKSVE